jgi:3-oxoadipate enol-lactonase
MHQFETIDGVTLHFRLDSQDGGNPCLAFINSLGTDLRIWDPVIAHLHPGFSLVRHDKRGHGLSDCPPGPYALSDHTTDLAGLLERLGMGPVILVGISVGGMIALNYASLYPDSVEAMVLCDTAAKIGSAAYWNERIAAVNKTGLEAMGERILERWFSPGYPDSHPAEYRGYRNMLLRTPVEGYTATCAGLGDADLTGILRSIPARTLVLTGTEDLATPPALGRQLAEALPNAKFDTIEGAGHLACLERPELLAERINRFLAV